MARTTVPLTATELKATKPKDKNYKLSDGGGLFLLVKPNGSKFWRLKYRFNGKEKEYAIGVYPRVTLSKARERREELKKLVSEGIDPNQQKKENVIIAKDIEAKKENTFLKVSELWLKSYKKEVSENYHHKLKRALVMHVYPHIKNMAMEDITRKDIITLLDTVKNKGYQETGRRTAMLLNKIYKYAVTYEYTPHNIIADIDLKIVVGSRNTTHYPTFVEDADIKGLLLSIDGYAGDYSTKMALKLLPFVFVRSANIRQMEWVEIDFKTKEWTIPAHKMKTKIEFIMPLPHQAIAILEEVEKHALSTKYVFPSSINKDKPLSENTLASAFRRMGYTKDEFVPHGFRAMFSTIAYEKANEKNGHGYTGEVIEALLAHKEPNKVKEAYNRSSYREAMRGLSNWYADYLEGVKNDRTV